MNDPHARFERWDAAYVLGALTAPERLEYEAHLEGCDRCANAVAELSGLPGLLRVVPPSSALSLLDARQEPIDAPPVDLLDRARARGRAQVTRLRRRIVIGVAAAAVLVSAVAIPVVLTNLGAAPSVQATLEQTQRSPLSASVELAAVDWGTSIHIDCSYDEAGSWAEQQPSSGAWRFALLVVDADGNETQVSSWKADPGASVSVDASTVIKLEDIERVIIRSLATGEVLMAADLPRA